MKNLNLVIPVKETKSITLDLGTSNSIFKFNSDDFNIEKCLDSGFNLNDIGSTNQTKKSTFILTTNNKNKLINNDVNFSSIDLGSSGVDKSNDLDLNLD